MNQVGLIGGGFHHAHSTTLWKKPTYFEWAKNQILDHTFWIDDAIQDGVRATCPNKYFWLVESRGVIPNAVQYVRNNHKIVSNNCKYLFTHYRELTELEPNFIFMPSHGTWIDEPQFYRKGKVVSLISSNKNWLSGHAYRLSLVERFKDKADIFGRGIRDFERKEEALAPYMFNICIENDSYDGYFSEKILDCFACGTIPIYYGDKTIDRCFDKRGIIELTDDFDVKSLTNELYVSMLPFAEINLELVKQYNVIEDWIFKYIYEGV